MENQTVDQQIKECLTNLPRHYDDPKWLSECAIQLSTLLYNLGDEMATARLGEEAAAVAHMDEVPIEGRRMSVAESEKRAITETNNNYERYKLRYQSVVETINSIKKRLDSMNQLIKLGA